MYAIRSYYGILHTAPAFDEAIAENIRPFFEDYYSIEFDNYGVDDRNNFV